ncbi:bifunctional hydroxymethylpyrimidine kinase/phosphomethylpyrimidine kinase [Treponema endosymbiont of Eucomonympha sp.]|uniref:bifunctional hydroxymethylpyrimidine kinase/phosphomethylpyrimidine kinase n=1 Tax=Treponema endosymbiont of Eucomonympha sp. TaxID=1580831 RepID=UPI000785B406|nr:bifunctional hydroxymethylpyrimidine kinase/phosphomethylpyrimidine kinase [Treponema endosymbiont of Eucomonympha sp.]
MIKVATIAGSDASGGAGLEADLKTFEEYGLYGMAAVTALATMDPAQEWAHRVFPVSGEALRAQLETVFRGVGVAAAKSGMLGSPYAVELTREFIASYRVKNYVLDPVMVCKGAGEALNPELNQAVADKLLPLAEVVTPNLFEASQLSGLPEATTLEAMKETARVIAGKGAHTVFVKGGAKLAGAAKAFDVFYDGNDFEVLEAELLKTNWTHGAGCTTSAAIAAGLARGLSVRAAVRLAKRFITQSLAAGFPLNKWVGPGNPASWRKAY